MSLILSEFSSACYHMNMIKEWYLSYAIKKQWSPDLGVLPTPALIQRLARLEQVVFLSSSIFTPGEALVQQYFAVQDQTFATKQHILQLAASLVRSFPSPLFQALLTAARELQEPIREVEVDRISDQGVMGKLDRTWYVFGDVSCLSMEQIELGVTIQTLANQFEQDGKYTFFLAQKQPKRLLGIFAVARPVATTAPEVTLDLRSLGLEMSLISDMKQNMARGFGRQLGISLVHGDLSEAEQEQLAGSILQTQANSLLVASKESASKWRKRYPEALLIQIGGKKEATEDLILSELDQLPVLIRQAQSIIKRAKQRLFWINFN